MFDPSLHAQEIYGPVPAGLSLVRFIPACAGDIIQHARIERGESVHPPHAQVICSETTVALHTLRFIPAVREIFIQIERPLERGRFIPTCAGDIDTLGA